MSCLPLHRLTILREFPKAPPAGVLSGTPRTDAPGPQHLQSLKPQFLSSSAPMAWMRSASGRVWRDDWRVFASAGVRFLRAAEWVWSAALRDLISDPFSAESLAGGVQ